MYFLFKKNKRWIYLLLHLPYTKYPYFVGKGPQNLFYCILTMWSRCQICTYNYHNFLKEVGNKYVCIQWDLNSFYIWLWATIQLIYHHKSEEYMYKFLLLSYYTCFQWVGLKKFNNISYNYSDQYKYLCNQFFPRLHPSYQDYDQFHEPESIINGGINI